MNDTWKGYQDAYGVYETPKSTNPALPYPTTDSKVGRTPFEDLKPSYPEIQANYDAMSPTWAGVDASNKATMKGGNFKSDAMPIKQ